MAEINWSDPCARAKGLSEARFRLMSGGQAQSVEYGSNETRRRVIYQPADLARLDKAIEQAEAECGALTGVQRTRRRYALSGAYRVLPLGILPGPRGWGQ